MTAADRRFLERARSDVPLLWTFGDFHHARRLALQLQIQLPCDLEPLALSRQHPLSIVD